MAVRVGTVVALLALVVCGCHAGDPQETQPHNASGLRLVRASPGLLGACRATARAVGYAVPCPTEVPNGLTQKGVIAADEAKTWRGWVFGSTSVGDEHLVLTASPRRLRSYAKLVNGPAWYPAARVKPLAWVTVGRRRMRAVYVSPDTNDGSAFADHVVLIWSVGSHTYGVGFHAVHGITRTLQDDVALVRHVALVFPPVGRTRAFTANGVRLITPNRWGRVVREPLESNIGDPRTVLVVGTRGVRPLASPHCQVAAYRLPPQGAVVVVLRWQTADPQVRPGLAPLWKLTTVRRPSFECFGGRGAAAYVSLGRHGYQVNVLVGDAASGTAVADALEVGRSLRLRH